MRCLFAGRLRGRRWGRLSASLLMAWFLGILRRHLIVQLWNVRTGDPKIRIADPSNRARAMAFYPEGTSLALVDRKQISVFNAETGALIQAIPAWGSAIAINRRQRFLATSSGGCFWLLDGSQKPSFLRGLMENPAFSP